jgi:hypothetical protein
MRGERDQCVERARTDPFPMRSSHASLLARECARLQHKRGASDIYDVRVAVDPQSKVATNILVRRGKEWHAPDRMVINARHIILVEPVGTSSKVAQLIADDKKQNGDSH